MYTRAHIKKNVELPDTHIKKKLISLSTTRLHVHVYTCTCTVCVLYMYCMCSTCSPIRVVRLGATLLIFCVRYSPSPARYLTSPITREANLWMFIRSIGLISIPGRKGGRRRDTCIKELSWITNYIHREPHLKSDSSAKSQLIFISGHTKLFACFWVNFL